MSGDNQKRQKGFSLPEVLIAAAIAAGVIAAAAQSIAYAVRLNVASARGAERLDEAALIVARVEAGMDDDDALKELLNWRIDRAPIAPFREHEAPIFDLVTLTYGGDAQWSLQFWAPKANGEAP